MTTETQAVDSMVENDFIEIRSPYRPYPIGAKKDLREAVGTVEFSNEDARAAFVSDVPSEELLDQWELEVVRTDDPVEVWVTDRDDRIEIYEDRVERDGQETSINPDEAMEKARQEDRFTRIDENDS